MKALINGNYVVSSRFWDNGAAADAGAVTWGSGTTGVSGVVSAANSLVGTSTDDNVGNGVTPLTNGNYVVISSWSNGATAHVGAVTFASGDTGLAGTVSAANSLIGSSANDFVGIGGVTALTNGNYVAISPNWDNGATANVGAVTWASGTTGLIGVVSTANSLFGSTANDQVGNFGVTTLIDGSYVVSSQFWHNGATANAGAVTWGSGITGVQGVVSSANSLIGSSADDFVGRGGVQPLTNGNYVVISTRWDKGNVINAGAATWGSGTTGISGVISAANSLVGSTAADQIGIGGVTLLAVRPPPSSILRCGCYDTVTGRRSRRS